MTGTSLKAASSGLALAAAGLLLVAANKLPRDAVLGPDYAQATYLKGYENSGGASNQFYAAASDQSCASAYSGAKFAPLSGSSKTVLLHAGKPATIYAVTSNLQSQGSYSGGGPGVAISQDVCQNKARFTPLPFVRYQIVQRRKDRGACRLEITDIGTNLPPADLAELVFEPCVKPPRKR